MVMTLGEALRRIRGAADLSQHDMATRLGVDPAHLSRVEADKKDPSLDLLRRFVEEANVPLGFVLWAVVQIE